MTPAEQLRALGFQFAVSVAVVCFWRGVWVLMDIALEALRVEDWQSGLISCAIGYGGLAAVVGITAAAAPDRADADAVNTAASRPVPSFLGRASAALWALGVGALVVNCWRGVWVLLDAFLLPSRTGASAALSAVGGAVLLLLMQQLPAQLAPPATTYSEAELENGDVLFAVPPCMRPGRGGPRESSAAPTVPVVHSSPNPLTVAAPTCRNEIAPC